MRLLQQHLSAGAGSIGGKINGNGDLVALIPDGTADAISPDLMRQRLPRKDGKAEPGEKCRLASQGEDAAQPESAGVLESFGHKGPANAPALTVGVYSQALDFPQIPPDQLQRAAADELSAVLVYHEIPQVLVQILEGTEQHPATLGMISDQPMDRGHVCHLRRTNHCGDSLAGGTPYHIGRSAVLANTDGLPQRRGRHTGEPGRAGDRPETGSAGPMPDV